MAKITGVLPERVFEFLRSGAPAVLVSVGADGWGHAVMTWARAIAPDRVRFGVDVGSTTQANLERDGKATLQVIGKENILALLKGHARVLRERMAATPIIGMWDLSLTEVKDQRWAPVVVSPLVYEWTGPEAEKLRQMEQAVLAEMRDWSEDR